MIGGDIPDRAVRSILVVVSTPSLQLFASILQRQEPVGVQAFAAQLAVERFDERIVCGLAWAGEVQDHTALVSPQIHVPRDKFAAIVDPDRLRIADRPVGAIQRGDHVLTPVAEPGIDHRR